MLSPSGYALTFALAQECGNLCAMGNIFAYFALITEIIGLIGSIRVMIATGTMTGATLAADVQPILATLQAINSKVSVPPALVQAICEAVAEVVAKFYKTAVPQG